MSIFLCILTLIVYFFLCWKWIQIFKKYTWFIKTNILFEAGLSFLFAITFSSYFFTFFLLIFKKINIWFYLFEMIFLPLIGILSYCISTGNEIQNEIDADVRRDKKLFQEKTFLLLLVLCFMNAAGFIFLTMTYPDGKEDALRIWNLRARFLYEGQLNSELTFSSLFHHTDYPLFLSGFIARNWHYLKSTSFLIPSGTAFIFAAITLLLIWNGVYLNSDRTTASLATISFLGLSSFIKRSASQYADVPLACFILLTVIFFYIATKYQKNLYYFLAGVSLGFCGWIKNEGLLFCSSFFLSFFIYMLIYSRKKATLKKILILGIGTIPAFLQILYFKWQIAPQNDVINTQTLGQFFNMERGWVIVYHAIKTWIRIDNGILVILFSFAALRLRRQELIHEFEFSFTTIVVLLFVSTGYFFVYMITPHSLKWHLESSLDRLFMHLLPAIWYLCGVYLFSSLKNRYL